MVYFRQRVPIYRWRPSTQMVASIRADDADHFREWSPPTSLNDKKKLENTKQKEQIQTSPRVQCHQLILLSTENIQLDL